MDWWVYIIIFAVLVVGGAIGGKIYRGYQQRRHEEYERELRESEQRRDG